MCVNIEKSFRIQLQKNLPIFDKLNEMDLVRTSLKQHVFTFCVKFLLCSLLYKLKLPNSFKRGALPF